MRRKASVTRQVDDIETRTTKTIPQGGHCKYLQVLQNFCEPGGAIQLFMKVHTSSHFHQKWRILSIQVEHGYLQISYRIIQYITPIFPLQKSVDGACNTCQHDSSPLRWRSLFPASSRLTCASSAGRWCSLEGCPAPSLRHHGKGTMESNDSRNEMSLVRWASWMLISRFQVCYEDTSC